VNGVANRLHRDLGGPIDLEDAVELRGPDMVVCHDVRREVAGLAQSFRVGKAVKGSPELHLGALQVVDISQQQVPADDASLRIAERKTRKLKPAVSAVEPPQTRLPLGRLA
jgi:hypothetical protein